MTRVEFTHAQVMLLHYTICEGRLSYAWWTDEKDSGRRPIFKPLENGFFNGWM
jgi:hypothetical protein